MTESLSVGWGAVRCPLTGMGLSVHERADAERIVGGLRARPDALFGATDQVLLRADGALAYPVVDGVPILLAPEALSPRPETHCDPADRRWREAYLEMEFYNDQARLACANSDDAFDELRRLTNEAPFPSPGWLDAAYDAAAQLDAFDHLGVLAERRVLQLGGKGLHAVKFLLAGAAAAWLVTPMHAEATFAMGLARRFGFAGRFQAVVAVAEQVPAPDGHFDAVYANGCLHHMRTDLVGPEIRRVLRPGGRFAAVEPWQTTMHRVGTRILGKREPNPYCRPLTHERISRLADGLGPIRLRHHGPFLRYVALGLGKLLGWELTPRSGLALTRVDDRLPLPTTAGGSVAVLAVAGDDGGPSSASARGAQVGAGRPGHRVTV